MNKPWAGEFTLDTDADMDEAAVRIVVSQQLACNDRGPLQQWPFNVGAQVRIAAGYCGAGHTFEVESCVKGERGWQVYGRNYGPVRATELELA